MMFVVSSVDGYGSDLLGLCRYGSEVDLFQLIVKGLFDRQNGVLFWARSR